MRSCRRALFLGVPVAWVMLAHAGPLIAMVGISFLDTYPVAPGEPVHGSLAAYRGFFAEPAYRASLARTFILAAAATLGALLLAYPLAYHVARRVPASRRAQRLFLLVAPFWTSEVLRMFALVLLLSNRGVVNAVLRATGVTIAPVQLLYGDGAVLAGLIYAVLLAMLLPLHAALDRLPTDVLEAASDLGAGAWQRFWHVTLPLTATGIAAGCALTFLACLGVVAAPALLGGAGTPVFAVIITNLFGASSGRWPMGAAFSCIVLAGGTACAGLIAAPLLATLRRFPSGGA